MLLGVLLMQFFRPKTINEGVPTPDLSGVPQEVNNILRNSCFDCHSSDTRLHSYDQITPANFLVASHVRDGKKALDFSKWESLPPPKKSATLYYALNKILAHEMPLPSYTWIHRAAKLSSSQVETLKQYAQSLSFRTANMGVPSPVSEPVPTPHKKPQTISPSPNGIAYIPDYRSWKAISTTDRFDNGSIRIIFANDLAVKAIEAHQTNPWPDGAIFAKAAWKQVIDSTGEVKMGSFIQVEFMLKDTKKFAKSKGWGWARWLGNDLKPYGEGVHFDQECIACHRPVKNRDYLFTSPLNLGLQLTKSSKNN